MKIKLVLFSVLLGLCTLNIFAQTTLPRESQRSSLSQTIGDTNLTIVYHRPNVKGRQLWGCQTADVIPKGGVTYPCLVPNGQVWRTGANEATVFEVSKDVKINGQTLPAGKYSLHTIPNQNEWTIIFNKKWDQWGSYSYDQKDDALRVTAKPVEVGFHETMSFEIENLTPTTAQVKIVWDKVGVPFTVDVGDVSNRLLTDARRRMMSEPVQMANFILSQKLTANYEEALSWVNDSLRIRETFGALSTKARLLAEMGRRDEAIATAEKAITLGKSSTPPANTATLEGLLAQWKAGK
ncbi:MAG TPA: DUF2911 domain-containing protein [Pyrinomonadaceae bacterium]|nr:DUF2911 domain-containing protein [Pyrinomonadaceae bacterium]